MDTNFEEQQAMYGIIGKLNEYGAGKEIIQIAKEDIEFGIGQDMILWYGESGWGADRIRALSKIVRTTKDQGFLEFIKDGGFSGQQMEVLLEFHQKGIPLAKLAELK